MTVRIIAGDALEQLRLLPDESVHCCVTSPPYYGLRDYGVTGQIGLEPSPDEYVAALVAVFREVRRVLRKDGTLWLNIGDSYAGSGKGGNPEAGKQATNRGSQTVGVLYGIGDTAREAAVTNVTRGPVGGCKPKDLIGIPWMLAFALRVDGWWLRSDIIWSKPAPMPESVTDRPTAAHEHIFLLSKSARYFFDAEAVKEPAISGHDSGNGYARPEQLSRGGRGSAEGWRAKPAEKFHGAYDKRPGASRERNGRDDPDNTTTTRNMRNVWHLGPEPFAEAHFATFPTELPRRAILAGCPKGGTVLDPFGGAGTTGLVADRLSRDAALIELNPAYAEMARRRIANDAGMFAQVAAE